MGISSDVSNLFKRLGVRADHYQEISEEVDSQLSRERWPGVTGKVEEPKQPSQVITVQPNVEPSIRSAVFDSQAYKPEPLVEQKNQGEIASHPSTIQSAPNGSFDWSTESLQSMLAKLDRTQFVEDAVTEPTSVSHDRPQLTNIQIVAVISGKGGVGKSTLAANIGATWQRQGKAVLVVDLDPQNAQRHHLGLVSEPGMPEQAAGIANVQDSEQDLRERCACSPSGVALLPYGPIDEAQRRAFERQLDSEPYWLARRLAELQLADGAMVILDTPGGASVYLQQALTVANLALVVTLSDAASYSTLPMIDKLIQTYAADRSEFIGAAYVINQADSSRQLNKDLTLIMRNILGERLIGVVHRDQSIAEALAYNRNVLDYAPSGQGSHDIQAVSQTILEMLATTERSKY